MSLKNIEREYSESRRILAVFTCFLAAYLCIEAAVAPAGDPLLRTLAAIGGTPLTSVIAYAAALVLTGLGTAAVIHRLLADMRGER